jgi:hypothetical protein
MIKKGNRAKAPTVEEAEKTQKAAAEAGKATQGRKVTVGEVLEIVNLKMIV